MPSFDKKIKEKNKNKLGFKKSKKNNDVVKNEVKTVKNEEKSNDIDKNSNEIKISTNKNDKKKLKGKKPNILGISKQGSKQIIKKKSKKFNKPKNRGVVFLKNIPHGFYEEEMRQYFSQFGRVTRVRVARSQLTGRSKGYAYAEFAYPEVAEIVAETMNNYVMFKKRIEAFYIPPEKQVYNYFATSIREEVVDGEVKLKSKKISGIEKFVESYNGIVKKPKFRLSMSKFKRRFKEYQEKYESIGVKIEPHEMKELVVDSYYLEQKKLNEQMMKKGNVEHIDDNEIIKIIHVDESRTKDDVEKEKAKNKKEKPKENKKEENIKKPLQKQNAVEMKSDSDSEDEDSEDQDSESQDEDEIENNQNGMESEEDSDEIQSDEEEDDSDLSEDEEEEPKPAPPPPSKQKQQKSQLKKTPPMNVESDEDDSSSESEEESPKKASKDKNFKNLLKKKQTNGIEKKKNKKNNKTEQNVNKGKLLKQYKAFMGNNKTEVKMGKPGANNLQKKKKNK